MTRCTHIKHLTIFQATLQIIFVSFQQENILTFLKQLSFTCMRSKWHKIVILAFLHFVLVYLQIFLSPTCFKHKLHLMFYLFIIQWIRHNQFSFTSKYQKHTFSLSYTQTVILVKMVTHLVFLKPLMHEKCNYCLF